MPRITPRRLGAAGAVAAAAVLLAAPAAFAGTASVEDGIPRYQAKNGEDNGLTVSEAPHPTNSQLKVVTFNDVVRVDAGPGCVTDGAFTAACNVALGVSRIRAGLEDVADVIMPASATALLTMGFSVEGDGGGDKLVGTEQHDVLDGVDGNDTLLGNGGDDSLEGATGDDSLYGGDDDDTIYGAPGEDAINGGPGNDYVDAGIHDDQVIGGTGADTMSGYYGNDTINADDNAGGDRIDCGPGYDKAIFNSGDVVNNNCELLQLG